MDLKKNAVDKKGVRNVFRPLIYLLIKYKSKNVRNRVNRDFFLLKCKQSEYAFPDLFFIPSYGHYIFRWLQNFSL